MSSITRRFHISHRALGIPAFSLFGLVLLILTITLSFAACSKKPAGPAAPPAELAKATRVDTNGWINVHLEGTPREIGFQHGWLLATEIDDVLKAPARRCS